MKITLNFVSLEKNTERMNQMKKSTLVVKRKDISAEIELVCF